MRLIHIVPSDSDVDIDKLVAAAVERVQAASKKEDSPPPQAGELLERGDFNAAADALADRAKRENLQLVAPLAAAAASNARELARTRIGSEEFDRWAPDAEAIAKRYNIDTASFVTPDQWHEAIKHAKAEKLDLIIEEERKKALQQAEQQAEQRRYRLPSFAAGSGGENEDKVREAFGRLTDTEKEFVNQYGYDPTAYLKNKEALAPYTDVGGSVEDAPVMDEDIPFHEHGVGGQIKPGRF